MADSDEISLAKQSNGGRNAASNVATQYNYTGIAVVLLLWEDKYGSVPAWASSLLTSTGV